MLPRNGEERYLWLPFLFYEILMCLSQLNEYGIVKKVICFVEQITEFSLQY